jgi:peptidoglycan hydrolase-like protein with peptidoglycan-binding domain
MNSKLLSGTFLCIILLLIASVCIAGCTSNTSYGTTHTNTAGRSTNPTNLPKQPPTSNGCPLTIQYGSQGAWVKELQTRLNILGWKDQEGKALVVDGIFGIRTEYAVKSFQAKHAPPVDGIVGPITWSALGYCSVHQS